MQIQIKTLKKDYYDDSKAARLRELAGLWAEREGLLPEAAWLDFLRIFADENRNLILCLLDSENEIQGYAAVFVGREPEPFVTIAQEVLADEKETSCYGLFDEKYRALARAVGTGAIIFSSRRACREGQYHAATRIMARRGWEKTAVTYALEVEPDQGGESE